MKSNGAADDVVLGDPDAAKFGEPDGYPRRIATYLVRIVIYGDGSASVPTIEQLERAIEETIVGSQSSAERVDS